MSLTHYFFNRGITLSDLHVITTTSDPYIKYIDDDPVRPTIPAVSRVGKNKEILLLLDNHIPEAIVCVSYQQSVPVATRELVGSADGTVAVFYTIWSYVPGSGKRMLSEAIDYIKKTRPNITRFVTLSPVSETAEKFHLSNGAKRLRTNPKHESVNYEYIV